MISTVDVLGRRSRSALLILFLCVVSTGLAVVLLRPASLRLAAAVAVGILILGIWSSDWRGLLFALPAWTVSLGLIRRLASVAGDSRSGASDPLLFILPLLLVLLLISALGRQRNAGRRTILSSSVTSLLVLVALGAVNPLQGSLTAGITSLVFFVPLLAFWVGRSVAWSPSVLRRVFIVIGVLGVFSAAYGLYQYSFGFPSWDSSWVAESGYAALSVGGVIRPFSSLVSSSEYATFLSIAAVAMFWLRPRAAFRPVTIGAAGLLLVALFLESARGPIFLLAATTGVVLSAKWRLPPVVAVGAAICAVLAVPLAATAFAPSSSNDALVQHQVSGLTNPTGEHSSLHAHYSLVISGVGEAFRRPLGQGLSVITIAAGKFGVTSQSTEADPSNVAVALGLPGLIVYLAVAVLGLASAYRLARQRRDPPSLIALGVLSVTFLQWLNGAQYAVAYLPWLLLGWIDYAHRQSAQGTTTP